jgi:hypothetical protein
VGESLLELRDWSKVQTTNHLARSKVKKQLGNCPVVSSISARDENV